MHYSKQLKLKSEPHLFTNIIITKTLSYLVHYAREEVAGSAASEKNRGGEL